VDGLVGRAVRVRPARRGWHAGAWRGTDSCVLRGAGSLGSCAAWDGVRPRAKVSSGSALARTLRGAARVRAQAQRRGAECDWHIFVLLITGLKLNNSKCLY
jgi:hypothetical protein